MFNKTKISTALIGLVGFDDATNPAYVFLDADNQVSTSGRKFTDNPFAKLEWFVDNSDYSISDDAELNAELVVLKKQAITNVCDTVFNGPDFIDRQLVYQFPNNKLNTETINADSFVGFRIETSLEKNQAFKISRVLMEFEGTGTLNLYLFNTASKTAIKTQACAITGDPFEQVLDWVIDYSNVAYYKGDFYIGYLANEAIAAGLTPIKRDYQNADIISCITGVEFSPIEVPGVTTAELWDLDNDEESSKTFGINPDITVYDDFTDLIIQNSYLFARSIQLQGQINFLSKIIASIRSNINQRFSKVMINKIIVEIEGITETNKIGLKKELLQEMNTLRSEIKKLQNNYFAKDFILNTRS